MNKLFSVLIVVLNLISLCRTRYVLPDVLIEPLSPKGLRVSMPVTQGAEIQLFGFHANINKPIRGKEEGDISRSSTRPINGRWIVSDDSVQLKVGDKLHYWLFAQSNRLGFDKEDQIFDITELKDAAATDQCPLSLSKMNNDEALCANAVIFEDNFNRLDESIWEVLQFTPQYALPGREFVSYENKIENLYFANNSLNIKPTIRTENELYDYPYDLTKGCSIDDNPGACAIKGQSSYEIIPPIKSARIRSKHAFKYGRIEVEAKLPLGNWLVPHILLEPRDYVYGNELESGEMYIAYNRGNVNLRDSTGDIGQNSLYCGPSFTEDRTKHMNKIRDQLKWGQNFYTYSLEWRPESITCMIDQRKVWDFPIRGDGFKSLVQGSSLVGRNWATPNAPFDQYFHLTIGLSVGGILDFPSNVEKPWDNSDPRASMRFFDAQADWDRTWSSDSTLRVKRVRVYAI